jgi:hypothetical protein
MTAGVAAVTAVAALWMSAAARAARCTSAIAITATAALRVTTTTAARAALWMTATTAGRALRQRCPAQSKGHHAGQRKLCKLAVQSLAFHHAT